MIIDFHGFVGSGKTTVLAYIAKRLNSGRSVFGLEPRKAVYSSFPLPDCYKLEPEKLGLVDIRDGTLLIDEVSSYFDNRQFMHFLTETMMYFKLSRHYHVDIVLASQSATDADKKIRQLVQASYIVDKMGFFSVVKPIQKWHSVSSGVPTEKYKLSSPLNWSFIYRPALYADFDSFQCPDLPAYVPEMWECSASVGRLAVGLSPLR